MKLKEAVVAFVPLLLSFAMGAFAMHLKVEAGASAAHTEHLNTLARCWEQVSQCEGQHEREYRALQQQIFRSAIESQVAR